MEINSTTILKSIIGSFIHYVKAIQIENKILLSDAKLISYNNLKNELNSIVYVKDNFLLKLDDLINKNQTNKDNLTILLRVKDLYEKNK